MRLLKPCARQENVIYFFYFGTKGLPVRFQFIAHRIQTKKKVNYVVPVLEVLALTVQWCLINTKYLLVFLKERCVLSVIFLSFVY